MSWDQYFNVKQLLQDPIRLDGLFKTAHRSTALISNPSSSMITCSELCTFTPVKTLSFDELMKKIFQVPNYNAVSDQNREPDDAMKTILTTTHLTTLKNKINSMYIPPNKEKENGGYRGGYHSKELRSLLMMMTRNIPPKLQNSTESKPRRFKGIYDNNQFKAFDIFKIIYDILNSDDMSATLDSKIPKKSGK